jgi:hypothetical protein
LARLVLLVCAGVVLDFCYAPYAVSELRMFIAILLRMPAQSLVIGDAVFCAYLALAVGVRRGVHFLCSRPMSRWGTLIKRLGKNDRIERWKAPRRKEQLFPHLIAGSEYLDVRIIRATVQRPGYRDFELVLATTLLDPKIYPREALIDLYLSRWSIELDIRTLKHDHGLARLSTKSAQAVCREICSAILAFNCVRALQSSTARNARSLSHGRAVLLILDAAARMSAAAIVLLPGIYKRMLELIGETTLDTTKRPPQPRAIIKQPRRYPYLKQSRQQWRRRNSAA